MNAQLLEEYADLKTEIARLTRIADGMKGKVLAEMQEASADEVELSQRGKLVVVPMRKWKYPGAIVRMEEELKEAKTEAEAKGTATYVDAPYVKFSALKE